MNPRILNRNFEHLADAWYQIEALGMHPNRAARVVQVIDREAADAIVNRFNADARAGALRHGGEMLIDHEHFSDDPDQETRAYGWLQELQRREDGIYGRIRWTATGKPAVDGGDYRFFSTEYAPEDLQALAADKPRHVRPLRLSGLTLTNMPNNRGQKPITNRSSPGVPPGNRTPAPSTTRQFPAPSFAAANASANNNNPTHPNEPMTSVCALLGLSADAEEASIHAAVAKLLNRGDISPADLAALRREQRATQELNTTLLAEQSDALLDLCGVRQDKIRNRLKTGLAQLANREDRIAYLADFGYEPGHPGQPVSAPEPRRAVRVLNRGNTAGVAINLPPEDEQARAEKIKNRCADLLSKGVKYDLAWNQARREVLGGN